MADVSIKTRQEGVLVISSDPTLTSRHCHDMTERLLTVMQDNNISKHGPVVQSVVSLTSSLRVISLTILADSIHNILIFFAEKM